MPKIVSGSFTVSGSGFGFEAALRRARGFGFSTVSSTVSSSATPLASLRLHRLLDHDERASRAGHAAIHEQEVPLRVDTEDLQALDRRPLVPHLAGHPHALEDAGGVGGADRARLPHVHGAVRLRPASEVVALDHSLEPFAFRGGDDVDQLPLGEDVALDLLAGLEPLEAAELGDVPGGRGAHGLEL